MNNNLPSRQELHSFCELLFTIGVDAVEINIPVYQRMEYLTEKRRFILNVDYPGEIHTHPGFYRYVCRQLSNHENAIYELQLNDPREIVKLRALKGCREIRIAGLDDIICYDSHEKILGELVHYLPDTAIILCPENNYGCASAIAIQWICEYGRDITASFAGACNNAATEELIMALRLAIRHKPNRDLTVLPQLTKLYEAFTKHTISNRKPIIGKNIFKVEAGIHVDGLKKNPATYEAYQPCLVGGKLELVIGKHSGIKALEMKIQDLGIKLPEKDILDSLLGRIKNICTQYGRSLTDEELVQMVGEEADIHEGSKTYNRYDLTGWRAKPGNCVE